jgi:hypothetical protein
MRRAVMSELAMLRFLAVLTVAGHLILPAVAQYGYSATSYNSSMYSQRAWDRMNERTLMRGALRLHGYKDEQIQKMTLDEFYAAFEKVKKSAGPANTQSSTPAKPAAPAKPAKPAKPASPPATRYTPSGKRIVLESVVEALSPDKEQRAGLRTLFKAGFQAFEAAAKEAKMSNDLAFAMAYFVAAAYGMEGDEVADKTVLALADSIQAVFDQPEMRKSKSAEKQAFSEFLVIMGTFLIASKEQLDPVSDAETLNGLKETSRNVLKQYLKLDPTKYKLTEHGLAKR